MILFIEKTWFLWWMLAIIIAVRWFQLLSVSVKLEGPDTPAWEKEKAYMLSWRILHKAQIISLFDAELPH